MPSSGVVAPPPPAPSAPVAPSAGAAAAPAAAAAAPAAAAGPAVPAPPAPYGVTANPGDLRGTEIRRTLRFPAGDRVVVSGLPGSGKSTLIRRAVAVQDTVRRIDSQDVRERWESVLPRWLPYAAYRPLVRLAHYAGLRRALASGASVVVHDCGSQAWVRNWLGRDALRRGRALHLVLLDVPASTALRSQAERGRTVSDYAFMRHRRAVRRLIADAEAGRLPRGCESVVLLDRGAAGRLPGMAFD
ncbi:AAA family ATPase [Streptomyces abyssalis]|uniref:AAA family ATPase n=1 Tax=Streptomyces abyssalis TaxID=933944 RepID=UPI003B84B2B0